MLLLDTCALLWMVDDPAELSTRARQLIETETEALLLSAISVYEIAAKHRRQRLILPCEPREWLLEAISHYDITQVPVDADLCLAANELPLIHSDPFDRLIIATAMANAAAIITADRQIAAYPGVSVQW